MNTRRIKIAFILTPITFGGSEKVSLNLLSNVDRNRFEIVPILLIRPWEPETYFGLELERIGLGYENIPVARSPKGDPLRVLRVAWRVYTMLKKGCFDLVHTQGYFADICSLPIARMMALPTIATCHGFITNDYNLRNYNLLDKYALRLCNCIIAVSESIKNELVCTGLREERIEVISNAVQAEPDPQEKLDLRRDTRKALHVDDSELIIGYLGRLSEEKGLRYLIEAAKMLRKAELGFTLLLVGDGPQKEELKNLSRKIEDRVIFTGFQRDITKWLTAMDIFVLPSLTEGTPMAMLEAMSLHLPVIATAVGGVPAVVRDGISGMLVRPADSENLSRAVAALASDALLRVSFGREGHRTVQSGYSVDAWRRKIEVLYEQIWRLKGREAGTERRLREGQNA